MRGSIVVRTRWGALFALVFLVSGPARGEDFDGDGLDDRDEIEYYETHPGEADTDNDGLEDGEEVDEHETDPTEKDTDGDGYDDGEEIDEGSDPNDPESVPRD